MYILSPRRPQMRQLLSFSRIPTRLWQRKRHSGSTSQHANTPSTNLVPSNHKNVNSFLNKTIYNNILKILHQDTKSIPVGAVTANDSKESSGSVYNILPIINSIAHISNMHKAQWLLDLGAIAHVVSSWNVLDKYTKYISPLLKYVSQIEKNYLSHTEDPSHCLII